MMSHILCIAFVVFTNLILMESNPKKGINFHFYLPGNQLFNIICHEEVKFIYKSYKLNSYVLLTERQNAINRGKLITQTTYQCKLRRKAGRKKRKGKKKKKKKKKKKT